MSRHSSTDEMAAAVHARLVGDPDADLPTAALRHARALAPLLPPAAIDAIVQSALARAQGLGPLDALLADPGVTEVMVNAGREVWVERAGALLRAPLALRPGEAEQLLERIIAPLGLRCDRTVPVVDARLADGSRVHAVVAPVAVDGTCLTIRRFGVRAVPLAAFAPPGVVELLAAAVRQRNNVLVSGPTSSGKTTLLNALASLVDPHERVVTIEDAAELRLPGDHVVRLEARPGTADTVGEVTIRQLVRAALRMRPDRLVIGEVRGAEALDMVQALSTGHDGSFATCHANSALDALRRVEAMVLQGEHGLPLAAVREQVHAALDLVVHVARGPAGARQVAEVVEVVPEPGDGPRVRSLAASGLVVAAPERSRRPSGVGR
jgi:pilus assembly protein CpaF